MSTISRSSSSTSSRFSSSSLAGQRARVGSSVPALPHHARPPAGDSFAPHCCPPGTPFPGLPRPIPGRPSPGLPRPIPGRPFPGRPNPITDGFNPKPREVRPAVDPFDLSKFL